MIETFLNQIIDTCRVSKIMMELYQLSDEELKSLDLIRADIPLVAYQSLNKAKG